MRLLHTSDWHIGHTPGRARRYDEHAAFLDWLAGVVAAEGVDALLVAGDVFDTQSPTNRAQELYYRFLCRIAQGPCRHVVVVAGNHDSPTFLNAPRALLRALDIHVVGAAETDPAEEVLLLDSPAGRPELAVCAVPYLRDRDIRESAAGESMEDKDRKLIEGIRAHYAAVLAAAEEKTNALGAANIPIIATGHLFAAGGTGGGDGIHGMTADDGVRELYVGSLARVPADVFPERFAYAALGHLHAPQIVGGNPSRRYSGAPLPMGFDEADKEKSIVIIDIGGDGDSGAVSVRTLPVPVFRPMEKITGGWPAIAARLTELAAAGEAAWIAVEYTGEELLPDLHARVSGLAEGSALSVVKITNRKLAALALAQNNTEETLDDLDPETVFDRCLDAHEIVESERGELKNSYAEILHNLRHGDAGAE